MANYTAADVKRLRDPPAPECSTARTRWSRPTAIRQGRRGAAHQGRQGCRQARRAGDGRGPGRRQGWRADRAQLRTDFVAKNDEFQALADQIVAAAVASKAADVDALKAAKTGDRTVEQAIADLSAKIGEKLELRRVAYFDGTV